MHLKILLISLNQHISNELKTLHIQSERSSHVEAVCVWVCWYWLAIMVNKKKKKKIKPFKHNHNPVTQWELVFTYKMTSISLSQLIYTHHLHTT